MILFHVQHLLGSGHVQRVRLLVAELAARGVPVAVATGGMPLDAPIPAGVDWCQLEPVRAQSMDFSGLVDRAGRPADDGLFARRREVLTAMCERLRPRVVVVESYPFGRRAFRHEIASLLGAARAACPAVVVACSVRDIVQRRGETRELETVARIRDDFDAVLVHGDPAVIPLDASFGSAPRLADRLVYTGYVAPPPVPRLPPASGDGEVVVSAGGGAAGLRLYEAAADAARQDRGSRCWRLLVGGALDDEVVDALARRADGAARVERNRPDFREILARAAVLVGQAGYNTVADILVTGVPALLIPFEGSGETEQLQRARRFEAIGHCRVVRETDLDAARLHDALRTVLDGPVPTRPAVDLGGVRASADWLTAQA